MEWEGWLTFENDETSFAPVAWLRILAGMFVHFVIHLGSIVAIHAQKKRADHFWYFVICEIRPQELTDVKWCFEKYFRLKCIPKIFACIPNSQFSNSMTKRTSVGSQTRNLNVYDAFLLRCALDVSAFVCFVICIEHSNTATACLVTNASLIMG